MKAVSIFWIFSTTVILAFSGIQTTGSLTSFCDGKISRNYPDPERCEGYITCVGVYAYKRNCQVGLHYNYQKDACDWPTNVNCQIKKKVNGNWGGWTSWSPCSMTCGGGRKTRSRICDDPSPVGAGLECLSSHGTRETYENTAQVCNNQACIASLKIDKCGTRRNGFLAPRLIGGKKAKEGAWPWQIGIVKKSADYIIICGGTLINSHTVLTAAHCIKHADEPEKYAVRVGDLDLGKIEDGEKVVDVKQLIVHKKFNITTLENDIAVMILTKQVQLTEACLPEKNIPLEECYVTGWGNAKQILNQARMPVVSKTRCKKVMKQRYKDGMLCAGYFTGGIDSCQGDSGGPLVCRSHVQPVRFYVKGIVSWGLGCAQSGTYGMYTDVPYYMKWIRETLKKVKLTDKS